MRALGSYDGALQMFIQPSREVDVRHLEFLRWLAERGRLEHDHPADGRREAQPGSPRGCVRRGSTGTH